MSCIIFLTSRQLKSQDIHFSQFYRSPLQLNPSLTGTFDGAYRFAGNLRQQWASVSDPYTTLALSADAANLLYVPKLGAGLQISNDRAGAGALQITQVNPSVSYSFQIGSDSTQQIVIGIQPSIQFKQLDVNKLQFGNQYSGTRFDPTLNSGELINGSSSNVTFHTGITYRQRKSRREELITGIAVHNVAGSQSSFLDQSEQLVMRTTAHAEWRLPFHPRMDISPGALLQFQGKDNETVLGANLTYLLDERSFNYRSVQIGIWNRFDDALIFFGGMEWDQLQVGFSYDINTSDLRAASNNRGGWEISAIYIIKNRLPQRKTFKKCPDFI